MIVNIRNEIFATLKSLLTGITVLPNLPKTTPTFPCVILVPLTIQTARETKDSAGVHHNDQSFQIEIYTTGDTAMSSADDIIQSIDGLMTGTYGMNLVEGTPLDAVDSTLYRYILRYDCRVDENRTIYGG